MPKSYLKQLISAVVFVIYLASVDIISALEPPTLTSPISGTTVNSTTLDWQAPAYPLYSASPYRVQVDDDPAFASINKDYYTNNLSYSPTLTEGGWNWRVKAKDSTGTWSDWSSIWNFILSLASPTPTPTPTSTPTSTP
ncbi:hypothetical protein HY389_01190, partial [Candidatus Daviesbacteria bacterium]|nr:hypothetical protein [Candidatus Daviesbacteria bacterium]